jgi:predicted  nucleic acid-binding Zn-ribbon protein
VLKDRFATSNLKTVDEKVLNALRVLWKDDLKEGAIAGELERRKKVADTQGSEAESEGEKMLRVRVEGCQVWHDQGIANKIYVQGQLELGLRHFRFTCREATEEENKALPRYRDKKLAKEGSVKGSVKDSKPSTENKENREKEKAVAIEIMRRTRKGKEKIKGRLLLHDRGERVFALSHDAGQYFSKVLLQ